MPKRPKYKRGFTLRHYFDEWWDRRPHEWKIRLFVFLGIAIFVTATTLLFWAHRQMERNEFVTEAKRLHEKRIQGADPQMVSKQAGSPPPLIPPSASLQVRPGE